MYDTESNIFIWRCKTGKQICKMQSIIYSTKKTWFPFKSNQRRKELYHRTNTIKCNTFKNAISTEIAIAKASAIHYGDKRRFLAMEIL